jgi:hypothetical protein
MFANDLVDRRHDVGITIIPLGYLVIGRPRQFDAAATSLHRQLVLSDQVGNGFAFIWRP